MVTLGEHGGASRHRIPHNFSVSRRTAAAIHRILWCSAVAAVRVLALLGLLIGVPGQSIIAWFIVAALLGGSVALALADDAAPFLWSARPAVVCLSTGLAALTALGLAALWAPGGVLVVPLYLTRPGAGRAIQRLRVLSRNGATQRPVEMLDPRAGSSAGIPCSPSAVDAGVAGAGAAVLGEPTDVSMVVPDLLSDEDLCLAWASGFNALQRDYSATARLVVVEGRQACLDELERRHPGALQRWLQCGPRAGGAPNKFLPAD